MHVMMIATLLLASTLLFSFANSYGFDAGASCSEKSSRRGRTEMIRMIPCDLSVQAYCNMPGNAYPWNAVRRFVHENQGLMKRMYGDVRHISVLRNEIVNNDIDEENIREATARYSGARRSKNADSGIEQTTNAPTEKLPTTTTENVERITKRLSTEKKQSSPHGSNTVTEDGLEKELVATVEEIFVQLQYDSDDPTIRMQEPNGTTAYETFDQSEIELDGKKDALVPARNETEAATISSTLKIFDSNRIKESEKAKNITITTPAEHLTTEKAKVADEKTNTTRKGLHENIIQSDDGEGDSESDDVAEEDSSAADSIQAEAIVDVNGKPAIKGVAQLYQDVAEKEEPIFMSSRGVWVNFFLCGEYE